MPIITSMILHYDPQTFVVSTADPRPAQALAAPQASLARTLGGLAAAGLAARLVELALSRRPR